MAEPEPLEQAFHKAVQFFEKGKLKKARQCLAGIQSRQPDLPDVLHLLSLIALRTDHPAEAVGYLEKAVRLAPGSVDLFGLLGGALKRAGRADDALAAFEKAVALDPGRAEVHYNMGNTLKELGRVEDAAASYRRATAADPGFADAYVNLGEVLKTDGRLEDAAQAYRDAVQANPADAEAHMALGDTLDALGDTDAALAALEQAVRADPGLASAHNNLGNALSKKDDYEAAVDCYRQALDLDPNHVNALINMGNVRRIQARLADAEQFLRRAVALGPNDPKAHFSLGKILMKSERFHEAEESFQTALQFEPDYVEALDNRGNALVALGSLDEAERCFNRSIELSPENVEAINNLGTVRLQQERPEEASKHFRHALEIDPGFAKAHNNLGVALHGLGSFDESVESYRQAIKLQPVFLEAHENLIKNRWSQGEGEDALSDLAAAAYAKDPMPPGLRRLLTRYLIKVENLPKAQEIIDDDPGFASSDAEMLCFQGNIHERNGDLDDAMEKYSEANRVNPNVEYEYNKIKMDFFKGKKESAINQIDGICNRGNLNHSDLLSFLALKGHMLKAAESEKYSDFFDYDTLVFSEKIDVPDGWSNLESFNAELALELEALHTGTDHPIDQTLRHGTQTAQNLFRPNRHPIIYALQAAITAKIEKYKRNLPADDGHVFLGNIPDEITYPLSWSVRLRSGGFHTNHIHPAGWLSSVYYVKLPPEIGDEEDSKAGWLKFGEPLDTDNIYNLSPDRWVKPEAGRLVLFPSYFWHGTEPFRSEDFRLTVAFDIAGKI